MGIFGIPSKKERELQKIQIKNCERILSESMKIMMTTEKIETFVSRYHVAREAVLEAGRVAGENKPCLGGITPKEFLSTLDNDLLSVFGPFIDRYIRIQTVKISNLTKNRIQKAQGLFLVCSSYENELPKHCIDYWNDSISKLVKKIEKWERSADFPSV